MTGCTMNAPVAGHYAAELDVDAVVERVRRHYPAGATAPELAPLDQLHIGGLDASRRLLERVGEQGARRVLDIGSGVGGLMRLGAAHGLEMIGVDITHGLNRLNHALSRMCESRPASWPVTGDAARLPLCDDSVDAVIFQHILMNVMDDRSALDEARRVLKPSGVLVMHEVISGPQVEEMRYPVPWSGDGRHSCLMTARTLRARLEAAGFTVTRMHDQTEAARAWRARQTGKERSGRSAAAALSPALVFGETFTTMGRNLLHNLEAGAIGIIEVEAGTSPD